MRNYPDRRAVLNIRRSSYGAASGRAKSGAECRVSLVRPEAGSSRVWRARWNSCSAGTESSANAPILSRWPGWTADKPTIWDAAESLSHPRRSDTTACGHRNVISTAPVSCDPFGSLGGPSVRGRKRVSTSAVEQTSVIRRHRSLPIVYRSLLGVH